MQSAHRLEVTLTAEQVADIEGAVSAGEYGSTSEVVREAMRSWQRRRARYAAEVTWLREKWEEGKASGEAVPLNLQEVRDEARRRLRMRKAAAVPHAS